MTTMATATKKKRIKQLKRVGMGLLILALLPILFIGSISVGLWGGLPSKKELSNLGYQRASEVYSADSVLLGKFYIHDRQPIAQTEIPGHVFEALVAIEDERFYDHKGIDYRSLFRVGIKTMLLGDDSAGGGSTITQQLAKNLHPRAERKKTHIIVDKLKEMIMARRLESIYDKKELLTHYFNTVSFGDNTFGIESAALRFYNKKTSDLNVPETATLIGMLKATYGYNPRLFPEKSIARRNLVLQAMHKNGYLRQVEKETYAQMPLQLNYSSYDHNAGTAPYFREEVRKHVAKWIEAQNLQAASYNLYTSGLKIYTTLHFEMQQMAEAVMKEHMTSLQEAFEKSHGTNAPWKNQRLLEKALKNTQRYKAMLQEGQSHKAIVAALTSDKRLRKLSDWHGEKEEQASTMDSLAHYMKFLNTGSISMDPTRGAVFTWIGGIDYKRFKFDHVSQSKRQVGSTFKPIVYTAALEKGMAPCTYFSAREVAYDNLEGWSPSNTGNTDEAYLNYSMKEALSKSVNTIAVKVLEATGIDAVVAQAKKMGITEPLPLLPSIALGTAELKMTQLAAAYTSYLNQGRPVAPTLITAITNAQDSILVTFMPKQAAAPAFTQENGQLMLEMMKATVNEGTASRIRNTYGLKNDIAGKTGTTQNNKDAWFVALTPKMLHISWVGMDNHEIGFNSTRLGQGANAALPLFAELYKKMTKTTDFNTITRAQFAKPSSQVREALDCEPIKRDGFLKRLFTNPHKKKTKKFKNSDQPK